MRRMSYTSDLEHWRIEAKATYDYVEETHIISDPTRGIRAQRTTQKWEVLRTLGVGGFGEVRLESYGQNHRAVKRIWNTTETRLNHADYERELKALLEFSKPRYKAAACFVEFYGWFSYGRDIFLAMEYVPLGDLDKVLGQHNVVPEAEAREIGLQILTGLNIMHLESFAHRDLKPGNVLVVQSRPWWVKLADFGLSKRMTGSTVLDSRGGTVSYMAPEVRLSYRASSSRSSSSSTEYTNLVDLWALGCIIYRLVTGTIPFPHDGALDDYCKDKIHFPEKELFSLSALGVQFTRQLLQANPNRRITSSEALEHPWITVEDDRQSVIMDRQAPSVQNQTCDDYSHRNSQQSASEVSASPQSSLRAFEFSENYGSVTHVGLKSFNYSSQSDLSPSEQSATIIPQLESRIEETKDKYRGSQEKVSENNELGEEYFDSLPDNAPSGLRVIEPPIPMVSKENYTLERSQHEENLKELKVKIEEKVATERADYLLAHDASAEATKGGAQTYAYSRYHLGTRSSNPGETRVAASDYTSPPNYSSGLSFTKGTVLYDITPAGIDPGWLSGSLSVGGKKGLFPEKYLGQGTTETLRREAEFRREEAKLRDIEVKIQREINEKRKDLLARESQLRKIEERMNAEQEAKLEDVNLTTRSDSAERQEPVGLVSQVRDRVARLPRIHNAKPERRISVKPEIVTEDLSQEGSRNYRERTPRPYSFAPVLTTANTPANTPANTLARSQSPGKWSQIAKDSADSLFTDSFPVKDSNPPPVQVPPKSHKSSFRSRLSKSFGRS